MNKRMVKVEWLDSCVDNGWKSEHEVIENTVSHCESVGYLLKKDKTQVSIIQNVSDTGNVSEQMSIPRRCVKRIIYLKEVN